LKITRYANAFLSIKKKKINLICDPWIGMANYGGWLSYPIIEKGDRLLKKIAPTHIYISHIHSDHLDETLLSTSLKKDILNKNIPIYIKNFKYKTLYKKIKKLGFTNIIELEPFQIVNLDGNLQIAIIPTDVTNSSNLQDDINYDIDTSIVIYSKKDNLLFYNNVDSPITLNGLKKLTSFTKKNFNKKQFDLACFSVGAASEYPQCFLNIDREKAKNSIVKSAKKDFIEKLDVLGNKNYFFSGGAYIIPGKFHKLNQYIAQPMLQELKKLLPKSKRCKHMFELDGGESIQYKDGQWIKVKNKPLKERYKTKKEAINKYKEMKYLYTIDTIAYNQNQINLLFKKSLQNYLQSLQSISINWCVTFQLYNDLHINNKLLIKKSIKPLHSLVLGNKQASYKLTCHLDYKLFIGLLEKKYNWNISLSGSIILFEREPNIFLPNITMSLNYLTI